jgi:hypothetical protein
MTIKPISKGLSGSLIRRRIKPEHFADEIYQEGRESHTQKRFISKVMNSSPATTSRWKSPTRRPEYESSGRPLHRSPSTLRLNSSHVKHKPAARGHMYL